MTSSRELREAMADEALARENDAIARKVGHKLRVVPRSAQTRRNNNGNPNIIDSAAKIVNLVETSIHEHPRETFAAVAVVAFGLGTLWRRGYL